MSCRAGRVRVQCAPGDATDVQPESASTHAWLQSGVLPFHPRRPPKMVNGVRRFGRGDQAWGIRWSWARWGMWMATVMVIAEQCPVTC